MALLRLSLAEIGELVGSVDLNEGVHVGGSRFSCCFVSEHRRSELNVGSSFEPVEGYEQRG